MFTKQSQQLGEGEEEKSGISDKKSTHTRAHTNAQNMHLTPPTASQHTDNIHPQTGLPIKFEKVNSRPDLIL